MHTHLHTFPWVMPTKKCVQGTSHTHTQKGKRERSMEAMRRKRKERRERRPALVYNKNDAMLA